MPIYLCIRVFFLLVYLSLWLEEGFDQPNPDPSLRFAWLVLNTKTQNLYRSEVKLINSSLLNTTTSCTRQRSLVTLCQVYVYFFGSEKCHQSRSVANYTNIFHKRLELFVWLDLADPELVHRDAKFGAAGVLDLINYY